MSRWIANFVNDPNNDYELMVEVLCDNEEVCIIQQTNFELEIILFSCDKDRAIPFNWFLGLMKEINKKLIVKNMTK